MAKKRVHEIAKEKGIPSKEVLTILQKAGFDVKAAASSVDEADVAKAFGNGAAEPEQPAAEPEDAAQAEPAKAPAGRAQAGKAARPRPRRGEGDGGGRRRRVVIDSQASRRDRPPPPPQQPARRGRGRRRRPRWVEPDLEAEAAAAAEAALQEDPPTPVRSGSTVKEVAESLQLSAPEVIKKLMELGEMATLTQTLSDEAIEVLADG